jgi:hypothetical protein
MKVQYLDQRLIERKIQDQYVTGHCISKLVLSLCLYCPSRCVISMFSKCTPSNTT